jgi:RNA recognition motif-containing protein
MRGSKLYVGNLSYAVTTPELKELFSQHGEVKEVNIIQGKGFGFVEMSNQEEAVKAKQTLNNFDFQGRQLKVDEARPPKKREGGFRSGGGGGFRGGGGGGFRSRF